MDSPNAPPARKQLREIARRAMLERGLLPDFSAAARAETDAIASAATPTDRSVRDLRSLLWASIDNDDSRDLDQLSVAVPTGGGAVKILIAVADVAAIVQIDSAIDDHARVNTTSVYTAAGIFPMLPEKLSTNLTSLAEGQERLAIVIEITVDAEGDVADSDVYPALVVNHAKLAYNSVAAWLDGAAAAPARLSAVSGLDQQLRAQDRVAQALKTRRHQRGALTLHPMEARAVFDGDVLADLRADERNRAKDLIEDFMIAVNAVTARYLEHKAFPSLRRILRSPQRWNRIVELAQTVGEHLPSNPSAAALEEFLRNRQQVDPQRFPDLSLCVVKLLGRGEYALDRPGQRVEGHFGLAVKDYTHSTAPNRRLPDLITQRLLKAALAGGPVPYTSAQLSELARHCTEQEDNAAKVERRVRKSAAAFLLRSRIGERFDAVVTGASAKGTWVRIGAPAAEGRVVRGYEGLDVGDRTRVELVDTNVERGFVDFVRIETT